MEPGSPPIGDRASNGATLPTARTRPRVIFVNCFFHPDHSATSQMLSDLAFALAAQGWPIEVVTSRQIYDRPNERLTPAESVRGVLIHRIPTTYFGRKNLFGRAVDYISFYISVGFRLLTLLRRGDILVAMTDPPMLSAVAAPTAWVRGARLVNWLQDVFPEVAEVISPPPSVLRPAFAVLRWRRDRSLRSAAMNVVIGQRMAEHLFARGIEPTRVREIPNWADGDLLKHVPADANPLRRDWGLQGKFVVGYSGNLGRAHEIAAIIEAIETLERASATDSGIPIVWLFIGGGAQFETLQREVERKGLTSVMLRPYQPREVLALSLGCADVHLVSLRKDLEGLIVPSKFFGIAAAGRAGVFIGDDDGEIARIIRNAACGLVVSEGDGKRLADIVIQLRDQPERTAEMGRRAREVFEARFSLRTAVAAWANALDAVTPRTRRSRD